MSNFLLHTLIYACTTSMPVLGYNMVLGKGKILHFGQEAQSIIAVYTLWVLIMQYQFSFFVSLPIAFLATMGISAFMAWLSFRLEPDGLGVMSIALHLALLSVVHNWQSVTRGALGIPRIQRWPFMETMESFAIAVVIVAIAWFLFLYFLDRGPFGRKLQSLAEEPRQAQALGISRKKIHLYAFFISGMGSMLSNIFYPQYLHLLNPNDYNFPTLITFVMMIVAGKPGSVPGVTLAVFGLVALRQAVRFLPFAPGVVGPAQLILFGIILFAAIWWRRDTMFPKPRSV